MEFVDRFLKCSDCGNDFVFTAGEQLFFHDKQFKNDPKRCKLCKAKRAGLGRNAAAEGDAALPFSRTETRTECSACGIETTVPFKPTQGRPVLCRSCFQLKRVPAGIPSGVAAVTAMDSPAAQVAAASAALDEALKANGQITTAEAEATVAQTGSPAAAESEAATLAQIAETPAAVLAESEGNPESAAIALEAPQAG
jgi:CxxC-x17-CxxC domain-containing protein